MYASEIWYHDRLLAYLQVLYDILFISQQSVTTLKMFVIRTILTYAKSVEYYLSPRQEYSVTC